MKVKIFMNTNVKCLEAEVNSWLESKPIRIECVKHSLSDYKATIVIFYEEKPQPTNLCPRCFHAFPKEKGDICPICGTHVVGVDR